VVARGPYTSLRSFDDRAAGDLSSNHHRPSTLNPFQIFFDRDYRSSYLKDFPVVPYPVMVLRTDVGSEIDVFASQFLSLPVDGSEKSKPLNRQFIWSFLLLGVPKAV